MPRALISPAMHTSRPLTSTLRRLEAESIYILREGVAAASRPVMLYSMGKDSSVMLHLARKAFHPAPPPVPLLHVDTTWEFRAMYDMRDRVARESGLDLLVHRNAEALALGINPFTHGSAMHTDLWTTQGLRQALEGHRFDVVFAGSRRDEQESSASEHVFSLRNAAQASDPKEQRPELWRLYNARLGKGESMRVYPLSDWTELDVWRYIELERIAVAPLYFAAPRPVVTRDGALIVVDDERMPLEPGEQAVLRTVRFRTLGCYPLTRAVESTADTVRAIIEEMMRATASGREGRLTGHDGAASMERK